MEEVESRSHLTDASVVTSHVIEGHSLAEFIVLTELLRLLEQVESAVDVFLFQVINCEDVADLAKLLACSCEFSRSSSEMHLLDLQELLQDANSLHIFALLQKIKQKSVTNLKIEDEKFKSNHYGSSFFY